MRRVNDAQKLTVPALSFHGLLTSSGIDFSRSSRTAFLFTTTAPFSLVVSRLRGTVQMVSLSFGCAGPVARNRSWRTWIPLGFSVTVSTG